MTLDYIVSQKNPPIISDIFFPFFPKRLGILIQILLAYYTFPSTWTTNFYSIICNSDEVLRHI